MSKAKRASDAGAANSEALLAERTLRERTTRRLNALAAVLQALTGARSLETLAPRLVRALCEQLGWDFGAVWAMHEESQQLASLCLWTKPALEGHPLVERTRSLRLSPGVGLPGRVWSSSAPAWVFELQHDANLPRAALAIDAGLRSGFAFPLHAGDAPIAVIEVLTRELEEPDEELLLLLATVGGQVGGLLSQWRVENRLAREVEDVTARLSLVAQTGALDEWRDHTDSDTLRPLLAQITKLVAALGTFLRETQGAATRVSETSRSVSDAMREHREVADAQMRSVRAAAEGLETLKASATEIASRANEVARAAAETLAAEGSGRGSIEVLISGMASIRSHGAAVVDATSRLRERVEQVDALVMTVDAVADRSDILALNAALEAARGGESGHGFALVAAEMRRLAESVLASTRSIRALVQEIREATAHADAAAVGANTAIAQGEAQGLLAAKGLDRLLDGVRGGARTAAAIVALAEGQRGGTEETAGTFQAISANSTTILQGAKKATSALDQLAELATRLDQLTQRFQAG
ncbi:MAG: GAF domain-containing protein [Myxococcaceae bacterium]|nr:GAF domain-containing protein [Myxococcaceae bacterium]